MRITCCLMLGALTLVLAGCGSTPPAVQPPEPPTVTFAHPVEKDLQPFTEYIGRLVATEEVVLTPEVTGMIVKINFTEGKLVKKGEVLYEIDPIPYKAAYDKALADVSNAEAQFNLADKEVRRLELGGSAVTKADLDKAVAQKAAASEAIKVAKALVTQAQFNLDKTRIVAPIDGRIGRFMKTVGNVITPSTQLSRITTVDPIYAVWDVDEQTSLYYRKMVFVDKIIPNPREKPLKCWIRLKSDSDYFREGYVNYIDPEVSRESASRPLRGIFSNPDGFMTGGDTVRVRVEAGPTRKVIMIPEAAVNSQQAKKFVYTINDKEEAMPVDVELGEVREGMVVVEKGVTTKDRIVVNGLLRVRPGLKVNPVLAGK